MGMKQKAPHLPPDSCSVETHLYMRNIKWMILVVLLAMAAGVTAALVTIAWFMPVTDNVGGIYFGERPNQQNINESVNPSVERDIKERMIHVYDSRGLTSSFSYTQNEKLGNASILSSDGWAVMYAPTTILPKQSIHGIDKDGNILAVENMVLDNANHLLYLDFAGSGFAVQSFADWSQVQNGKSIVVANKHVSISHVESYNESLAAFDVWNHVDTYRIDDEHDAASIAYDENGRLIGFIDREKNLSLAWSIPQVFPSVVEKKEIQKTTKTWTGEFIEGYVDTNTELWIRRPAFVITKVGTDAVVKIGDVITQINGRDIDVVSFGRMLQTTQKPFEVTLIRDEKEIKVTVQ